MPYRRACLNSVCALVKLHCSFRSFEIGSTAFRLDLMKQFYWKRKIWLKGKKNKLKILLLSCAYWLLTIHESLKLFLQKISVFASRLFGSLWTLGVFLLTTKNAFVPVKRDNSVDTYLRISTVPWGSERSEWTNERSERPSGTFKTRSSLTRNAPTVTSTHITLIHKTKHT